MDKGTIKTPNPKCRLSRCLTEVINWRCSQSCWYCRPALWTIAPLPLCLFLVLYLPEEVLSLWLTGTKSKLRARVQKVKNSEFWKLNALSLYVGWSRGSQRDVVYLGWPIAPSYMSPIVLNQCCVSGSVGIAIKWPSKSVLFHQKLDLDVFVVTVQFNFKTCTDPNKKILKSVKWVSMI